MITRRRLLPTALAGLLLLGTAAPAAADDDERGSKAPRVALEAPAAGDETTGLVTMFGSAKDDEGVTAVRVGITDGFGRWWDGEAFRTGYRNVEATLAEPGAKKTAWKLEEDLPAGLHTIAVTARDAEGPGRTTFRRVRVLDAADVLPPRLDVVTPERAAEGAFTTLAVRGLAVDDGGQPVRIAVAVRRGSDGRWLGPAGWSKAYTSTRTQAMPDQLAWELLLPLASLVPAETYTLSVFAVDVAGNRTVDFRRVTAVADELAPERPVRERDDDERDDDEDGDRARPGRRAGQR